MERRLVLVEGIPGSGKTTTAKKIERTLCERGENARCYTEGMLHPADTAWCAYLTEAEYDALLDETARLCEKTGADAKDARRMVEAQSLHEDGHVLVAYTRLAKADERLRPLFESLVEKELCDGRSPLEVFREVTLRRWRRFGERAAHEDATYIFECTFLQNQLFELAGTYCLSDEAIVSHMRALYETIRPLAPKFYYMRVKDVAGVIRHAARERISPRGAWIDEIVSWVENSPYGKRQGLHGEPGVVAFCEERMRLDLLVLDALRADVEFIDR